MHTQQKEEERVEYFKYYSYHMWDRQPAIFPLSTASGKTFIKMNLQIRKMQTEHKVGGKHFVGAKGG